jgi:hypothetical protein
MTAKIAAAAIVKVVERLGAAFEASQIRVQNVAFDLAEKTAGANYPAVYVHCDKIINDQVEKFRSFSGRIQVAVEVRLSQDRLDGLSGAVDQFVDAVGDVLRASRGDWGDGMFYGGRYEVAFGAIKHGGKNFIQPAKVIFEIGVSKD